MGNDQGHLGGAGGCGGDDGGGIIAQGPASLGDKDRSLEKAPCPSGISKINAEGHTPNPRPTQPRENQPRAPPPRDHLDN
jgi:hypothetical protein